MKNAEDKIDVLVKIKETDEFTKLEELYKDGIIPIKRENVSASLKGRLNISNQIKETLQNAEKEVIICTNVNDINSKIKLFEQTFNRLRTSDVKLKVALNGDEKLIEQLSKKLSIKFKKINIELYDIIVKFILKNLLNLFKQYFTNFQ